MQVLCPHCHSDNISLVQMRPLPIESVWTCNDCDRTFYMLSEWADERTSDAGDA